MLEVLGDQRIAYFKISGDHYKRMMYRAVKIFKRFKERLNRINVYPVADGDTGNNIYFTLRGIWKDLKKVKSNDFSKVAKVVSESALKNAKGNSGNILAMFLYGIYDYAKDKKYFSPKDLGEAFDKGAKYAYSAVGNPKEGTILTAMRVAAETIKKEIENGVEDYKKVLKKSIVSALRELEKTRVKVPQLKKHNVIDAGGLGFIVLLQAWTNSIKEEVITKLTKKKIEVKLTDKYCVNMLMKMKEDKIGELKEFLESVGDSIVIKRVSGKVKLHFHCPRSSFDSIMTKILDMAEVVSQEVSLA